MINLGDLVRASGFKENMPVIRPKDKTVGTIVQIANSEVWLQVDGETKSVSTETFTSGQWKPYKEPKPQEEVQWKDCSPLNSNLPLEYSKIFFKRLGIGCFSLLRTLEPSCLNMRS